MSHKWELVCDLGTDLQRWGSVALRIFTSVCSKKKINLMIFFFVPYSCMHYCHQSGNGSTLLTCCVFYFFSSPYTGDGIQNYDPIEKLSSTVIHYVHLVPRLTKMYLWITSAMNEHLQTPKTDLFPWIISVIHNSLCVLCMLASFHICFHFSLTIDLVITTVHRDTWYVLHSVFSS